MRAHSRAPVLGEVEYPIWKCSWCARRKGKLIETEIELLERWVNQFGWTLESLVFHANGKVYACCQLPTLREAASGVRRENRLVPTLPPGDTGLNGDVLFGKGECAVA
jgi:hypothetical protein